MKNYLSTINQYLTSYYDTFSESEKIVADYFLSGPIEADFSTATVAGRLFISEATLSRFAKKAGFRGYREFVYFYNQSVKEDTHKYNEVTQSVLLTYTHLLEMTHKIINEKQIERVIHKMSNLKQVYVYGLASSGLCALEFQMRFMRLGLKVDAITDSHLMKMNTVLMDSKSMLICMSLSGKNLNDYLKKAKQKGSYTVLITANDTENKINYIDEIIKCASIENLDIGHLISPQFPILVLIDILYAYYLHMDYKTKYESLTDTLDYINR